VVAYATMRGRVYAYDAAGSLLWRSAPYPRPRRLAWSSDGARLALVTADRVVLLAGATGRPLSTRFLRGVTDIAFAPSGHDLAVARTRDVLVLRERGRPQRVFAGVGPFVDVAWSPDRRWILIGWRDADQWVFVRVAGKRRIEAVSRVTEQFESTTFPRITGWCCARRR
jgi:dipeptidyl aminopeptidase/acylaminoacyl peptidase